eukprot:CAMPEP_0198204942 /NCGR_PEP_ID=MMETSP1445-20131203/8430_1 /TAXON_ID=36898 /ORGANISM="Pyramimonas sp., Strain CCMP2087" /LENGTH=38 /DNA_ID= /DNA_START= /DNA_END= /DNA_ORIENTATION=
MALIAPPLVLNPPTLALNPLPLALIAPLQVKVLRSMRI